MNSKYSVPNVLFIEQLALYMWLHYLPFLYACMLYMCLLLTHYNHVPSIVLLYSLMKIKITSF